MNNGNYTEKERWNKRYLTRDTPWNIGYPSPAILDYTLHNIPLDSKILIPGAGNAYEAEALHRKGYNQVFVCDWAEEPMKRLKERVADFPDDHLLVRDFFELTGQYDFILEQTFFSAISPRRRQDYARKCHELLLPNGKLIGVLFMKEFETEGPPFGGTIEEYQALFDNLFHIIQLHPCSNSIKPRMGTECFIELQAKTVPSDTR